MRTCAVRAGGVLTLTAGLLTGCQSSPRRAPYAANPLLQARQPLVQSSGASDRLARIAQVGPHTVVPPPGKNGFDPAPAALASAAPETHWSIPPAAAAPPLTPGSGPSLPEPVVASPAAPPPAPLPARDPATAVAAVATVTPAPNPLAAADPIPSPLPEPSPADAPVPAVAAEAVPAQAPVAQASVRTVDGKYGCASDHTWLQGELDRHYRGHLELRFRPVSEEDAFGGKVRLENDPRLAEFRAGDVVAVEGELIRDPESVAHPLAQSPRYHIRTIRLIERK